MVATCRLSPLNGPAIVSLVRIIVDVMKDKGVGYRRGALGGRCPSDIRVTEIGAFFALVCGTFTIAPRPAHGGKPRLSSSAVTS